MDVDRKDTPQTGSASVEDEGVDQKSVPHTEAAKTTTARVESQEVKVEEGPEK